MKQSLDELETEVAILRDILEQLNWSTPWPVFTVLKTLTEATGHLLEDHNCDREGWEEIKAARDSAKEILARFGMNPSRKKHSRTGTCNER